MLINNAKVKVLSAPRSGISQTGNNYTISDLVLGWDEQVQDSSGNMTSVENSVHITLGTNWVSYVQQLGLKVGDVVSVDLRFICRSSRGFLNNDVALQGLSKV